MTHAIFTRWRSGSRSLIPSSVILARWRVRQTWQLLLVTWLGMVAAVIVVCATLLFSQVAQTAGLRQALTASPEDPVISLQSAAGLLSTQVMADDKQQLNAFMQAHLGRYLSQDTQFRLSSSSTMVAPSAAEHSPLILIGADIVQATPHIKVLQGRLPAPSSNQIEIAITEITAFSLHLSVGATITTSMKLGIVGPGQPGPDKITTVLLPVQVVGIIEPPAYDNLYWHGENFQPALTIPYATYQGLLSNDTFLNVMTQLAHDQGGTTVATLFNSPATIFWFFQLNPALVSITNLDDLITRLNTAQIKITQQFDQTLALFRAELSGTTMRLAGAPGTLERFRDRLAVIQVPAAVLTTLVVALILFFVSLMAHLLIERQSDVIALLRSRGASRRQVFAAFLAQAAALGLLALIVGPALALLATNMLGHLLLSPANQNALNIITNAPMQAMLSAGWLALGAVVAAMLALLLSVWFAAQRDILIMRRAAARSQHAPLWQRLQLDVLAALIALAGYGIAFYLTHSGALDASTNQLIVLPLSLIGPIFLLIAGVLLFLRLFPALLRLFARQAGRRPGAAPMLALAQMSRAPGQSLRLVLLLSLSAAFAIFTLAFNATETQQIRALAVQQAGADFSGELPKPFTASPTPAQWEASYQAIPGVLAASAGYVTETVSVGNTNTIPMSIRAVDTHTFAQAAMWTAQDSNQSLADLLTRIAPVSSASDAPVAVPAIVDTVAWNALHLTIGARFTLAEERVQPGMPFVAVAEVQHIPTVNDSLETSGAGDYITPGGVLVDYDTYVSVYSRLQSEPMSFVNYIWLRSSDSPAALARIRGTLNNGSLALGPVFDRQALLLQMQQDPLYLIITGLLSLGMVATLLLALIGTLLASWLNARSRLTTFAVLRALGGTPRQIGNTLAWEQSAVYLIATGLGILFGALLAWTALPNLVITNPVPPGTSISNAEFYVIQHALPVQIILPGTVALALAALVAICLVALVLMARLVSQPSLSQTLRLNAD
ncbi:MAG TPA: FtsX-like permease family protein [Ktedonobacterales bacterium]